MNLPLRCQALSEVPGTYIITDMFNNRPPVVVVNGRWRPGVERGSQRSPIDRRAVL